MLTEREKFISVVDNDIIVQSDAIILLEGDGYNRYQHAVNLYKTLMAPLLVFSGGIVDYKYGSIPYSDIKGRLFDSGIREEHIIHENLSLNTREQAEQVIKLSMEKGWTKLILVASCEHQYRAYLTFLKVVLENKISLIIFNSPARNLSWFKNCDWGIRFDKLDQEFDKIEKYSKLGHMSTYREAIDYQKWKEEQILK